MTEDKHDQNEHRLTAALKVAESNRLQRMEKLKAKRGNTELPLDKRKLTLQEAAAYCGVSTATICRWADKGLKTVKYGKWRRYMLADLKKFINEHRRGK